MKNVAFLGLGVMGELMAGQLLRSGHQTAVWNRTPAKADGLVKAGARRASSPGDAAAGVEAVFTMVADDAALREVCYGESGILPALARGGVHVSMSTVSPEVTAELAAAHLRQGSSLLCAPVFGSRESAGARKLYGLASGPREVYERCLPSLEALSQRVFYLGEDPAAAARLKLLGNMLISSAVAAMVQAFTAAERSGLDPAQLMDIIRAVFNSPLYERYGVRLVNRNPEVHFPLKLMLKDISLALSLAAQSGVAMPSGAVTREMLAAAIGQGRADADAAVGLLEAWEAACGGREEGRLKA